MTASKDPRIVVAGLSGDAGRTQVSLALLLGARGLGHATDSASRFSCPGNLAALEASGATLVPRSSMAEVAVPSHLSALCIAGGSPGMHAAAIAGSRPFLASTRAAEARRLPILAGCGGGRDAIVVNRVWVGNAHVHAAGVPAWADGLVPAAREYRQEAGRPS